MAGLQNVLNAKLLEIQKNKEIEKARFRALTKQREQAEHNYIALDGAEQMLLEIIKETENNNKTNDCIGAETEIIEEVSAIETEDNN